MNLSNQVTLKQAATLIRTCGATNTFLLQGQPGVGKSAILKTLSQQMPDFYPCYIDCANQELGDLGMPVVDKELMQTSYAPSTRFGVWRGQNRPVLLMFDELGKSLRPVLNMLLPAILEHRIGDVRLPRGSIALATTNLATDGVGDNIPAHAHNRMSVLDVRNPTYKEWLEWAANNDIAPEIMLFAHNFPQIFERYDEIKDSKNPYIFNPLTGNIRAFCSPRSLEKASNIVKARDAVGDSLLPALCGTIGESAAGDMEAMVALSDQMPRFDTIIADPKKAKLPGGAAYFLMAFMLAGRATAETMQPIMDYVNRFEQFEATALFASTLASNNNKVSMACKNRDFTKLAASLGKFF